MGRIAVNSMLRPAKSTIKYMQIISLTNEKLPMFVRSIPSKYRSVKDVQGKGRMGGEKTVFLVKLLCDMLLMDLLRADGNYPNLIY